MEICDTGWKPVGDVEIEEECRDSETEGSKPVSHRKRSAKAVAETSFGSCASSTTCQLKNLYAKAEYAVAVEDRSRRGRGERSFDLLFAQQ